LGKKKSIGWMAVFVSGVIVGVGGGFEYGKRWQLEHTEGSPYSTSDEIVKDWYDGDTLTLSNGEKIRLYGIDTPEIKPRPGTPASETVGFPQPGAIEARNYATKHWGNGTELIVKRKGRDKYGRTLAELYDRSGRFINQELIDKGHAREYKP
jgi:micrococcal nuclease